MHGSKSSQECSHVQRFNCLLHEARTSYCRQITIEPSQSNPRGEAVEKRRNEQQDSSALIKTCFVFLSQAVAGACRASQSKMHAQGHHLAEAAKDLASSLGSICDVLASSCSRSHYEAARWASTLSKALRLWRLRALRHGTLSWFGALGCAAVAAGNCCALCRSQHVLAEMVQDQQSAFLKRRPSVSGPPRRIPSLTVCCSRQTRWQANRQCMSMHELSV